MQKLTNSEAEIMHWLWQMGRGTVAQLIALMPAPAPPQSTISSFIRILEKKGYVGHEAYGKTHVYFPVISKETYGERSLGDLMRDYFDGSASRLVSFLVEGENLSENELAELRRKLDELPGE